MKLHGVRRLIVISMLEKARAVPMQAFSMNKSFCRRICVDRTRTRRQWNMRSYSDLDWLILRPTVLSNKPATGNIRIYSAGRDETAHTIIRADVAAFLVQQLISNEHLGRAVIIAND